MKRFISPKVLGWATGVGLLAAIFFGTSAVLAAVVIPATCSTPGSCPDLDPILRNLTISNIMNFGDDDTNLITVQAPVDVAADYSLTLPGDDGIPGSVLSSDGAGNLIWSALFQGMTGSVHFMPTDTANFDDSIGIPLNGQTVLGGVADYPALAAKITAGEVQGIATIAGADLVMADWNEVGTAQGGYFLRGLGDRVPGSLAVDSTARPNTPFTTNTTGNHSHSYNDRSNNSELSDDANDRTVGSDGKTDQGRTTGSAGNHSHSITGGGDAETAPKAASGLLYVFAIKQ